MLIVNGDTWCPIDLGAIVTAHHERRADVTMAVIPNPAPDQFNGLVVDAAGRVCEIRPKGQADGTWHFIGAQVVNTSVLAGVRDDAPSETVSGLYRDRLARGELVHAWRTDTPFLDVGTPRDYLRTALSLAPGGAGESVIEPGAVVDRSATLDRSVIWPGARVGAGAALSRCVVAGEVRVPANRRIEDAVIVPASLARPDDPARIDGEIAMFPL